MSHNPESNMKLASGTAPVLKYLAAGVSLSLGTDGAASNNDLDMFEAMRQASFLAKLSSGNPTAVPAQVALDMATIGGAKALGMDKLIGSLEPGKRADLITVSMSRGAPDADVRRGLAPRLRHARRRRADHDRERQGADARPAADARSTKPTCWLRRGRWRRKCATRSSDGLAHRQGSERRSANCSRARPRYASISPMYGRLRYCSA